eukprot:Nitzschia sp. Nitz4//scaffold312_size24368//9771//10866//NITZ4_008366-RA/size24368-augustus-gene-0.16-mRNA-1//1//CDS//3329547399//7941//frame0
MRQFLHILLLSSVTLAVSMSLDSLSGSSMLCHRLPFGLRGGEAEPVTSTRTKITPSYANRLEVVKASVLEEAAEAIEELRQQIVNQATIVEDFGSKAETICNNALEDFAKTSPDATDASSEAIYDRTLESLEAALDAPLQILYLRQLSMLRDQALQRYRAAAKTSGASEYEAMLQADAQFVRAAEASMREGGADWDYSAERGYLQSVMNSISESSKKVADIQVKSAQQQQTAMQFLQQQQHMIQQLQVQLYGQNTPWNIGFAYRFPNSNFNLQGTYQQGRTNVQVSCVADEYAPFLGPHGFTKGVGPANLGLSLNLSL